MNTPLQPAGPSRESFVEQLYYRLISGNRSDMERAFKELLATTKTAEEMDAVLWKVRVLLGALRQSDSIERPAFNYGIRGLRELFGMLEFSYTRKTGNDRTVLFICGHGEPQELGGLVATHRLEAEGYTVWFAGSGLAADDIHHEVGKRRPDFLLLFDFGTRDLFNIKHAITMIREIGACPNMLVVAGAGVFVRPGPHELRDEIGADMWVRDPQDLVETLAEAVKLGGIPPRRTTSADHHRIPWPLLNDTRAEDQASFRRRCR